MSERTAAPAYVDALPPAYVDALPPAEADPRFDNIAALARRILQVPIALVSIVTHDEHRLPGYAGDPSAWEEERTLDLNYSLCRVVVTDRAPLVMRDGKADERMSDHPAVVELGVGAYVGVPLTSLNGDVVGTLCIADYEPHDWTQHELDVMTDLTALCTSELQLRQAAARTAVAADRDRIARDLHSEVFGQLSQLSLVLAGLQSRSHGETAEMTLHALDTVDDVLKTIRRTIFARPPRAS